MNLQPNDRRPLYLQIMDEVRRAVVVGSLRADEPLPSVRELAAELVVNPRTVLQAYQELEREGVVYVRRGQGTFVSPAVQHSDASRRRAVAVEVARIALKEAQRNGLEAAELIEALQQLTAEETGRPKRVGEEKE